MTGAYFLLLWQGIESEKKQRKCNVHEEGLFLSQNPNQSNKNLVT